MATRTVAHLTCICCPRGCALEAVLENDELVAIAGNRCPRGKKYAADEIKNPVRTVTTTVVLEGSPRFRTVPVKTSTEVPKDRVRAVVDSLAGVTVEPPVHIGDVIVPNVLGTGANIVATANRL